MKIEPKYMLATKAYHPGTKSDISSDDPDICRVFEETETNYTGVWVFGLGFLGVQFPKETTRDLTQEEKNEWNGTIYEMSGLRRTIQVEGATNNVEVPDSTCFIVKTKNSNFKFSAVTTHMFGEHVIKNRNCIRNDDEIIGEVTIESLIIGKPMVLVGGYITSNVEKVETIDTW